MNNSGKLTIAKKDLASFCKKNHIRKLSLFGSVLSEDFRKDSDVDILVEFEPGKIVGLIRMAALERELSAILNRKVDLRTPADLSRHFRDEVLSSAVEQYAQR